MDNSQYFESFIKKKNITRSNWGGYTLDIQLWEDEKSPIVNLRSIKDVLFDDLENNGIFTDRLIGLGSSFLTKSPESGLYILAKCIMRKMSLVDITILYYHRYLQYIDLAHNNLTNLIPLGGIPYLMYLNASYNKLIDILNFTPPWYLTYVNLSHNYITQMCDLSSFWSIVRLDLSHNEIEVIFGLHNLKYLQYLNLSYNSIEYIENLDNLNIKELNLEGNCITSYKCNESNSGMKSLINLKTIILGYNKLSTLDFFKDACSLRFIDLKYNKIIDLLEVSNLKGSIYEIDLRGNACIKWPNYRDVILFSIPSVMFIDGIEVSIMEKISAATLFAPSLNLITARNISKLTLLEHLSTPKIDTHVIAYDKIRPPLLILTGPYTTMQICNRYLNVKPILVITNDIAQHLSWIEDKFDIYSWIQDSVGDLLAINVGKHTHIKKESKSSILNFILGIIEQIMNSLELPGYSMFVRPQGTGATTTDIIYESKTMLPKIKIVQDSYLFTGNKQQFNDLKVLLDEESNIIIHNIKHKRRKSKRTPYEYKINDKIEHKISADDDINDTSSSEETLLASQYEDDDDEKPENLKRMYVQLVLKTRKIYLEHHEKNPGFFSLVLLTDNYTKAFNILMNFIQKTCAKQLFRSLEHIPEIKYFLRVAIPDHIQYIIDKMKEYDTDASYYIFTNVLKH